MQLVKEQITLPTLYTVPEDQIARRDKTLAISRKLDSISDAGGQMMAVNAGRTIQADIKAVQEARKELAAPLNAAAKKLIQLEEDYLAPLIAEKDRLGRLVSAYQTAEAERVAREQKAAQDEFQRLEQERLALERKAAQEAPGSAKAIKFEQRANDAMEAATDVLTPPVEVSKAKGSSTRKELRWEVTNEAELYAAAPHLFSKPELKPSAVKSCCTVNSKIAGIRFWEEDKTSFRA